MALFGKWSRREILKSSGVAAVAAPIAAVATAVPAAAQPAYVPGADNLFSQIGVRPILNARGTYTIISGSRSLPQVKQAMFEASHYYVQLDEMMNGIGAELATLTGAEWGIVTNGCEAAICLATIACIAGGNVEKCQALPERKAKDQVIIPKHSRNPYDIGVRMVGVEVIEVETPEELRAKMNARTAMIYVMSDPSEAKSQLPIARICSIAREKGVPVFVDAAAEELRVPNIHLAAGATLVGYSGGKCLRGPQSSGMLIGDKSLCKAAYYQASPHHAYGRALKCSKEESMGLLAAVRQWRKRDHDGEQRMWRSWLNVIEARLKAIPTIRFEYLEPADLSNRAPRLRLFWDAKVVGITGTELVAKLDAGNPRIMVESGTGKRPDQMASTLTVMPYMMDPGEEKIVADALHAGLTNPGKFSDPMVPKGAMAKVAGEWAVTIAYLRGEGHQRLTITQSGDTLGGTQKGELYDGTLTGLVRADMVEIKGRMAIPGNVIPWTFKGKVTGNAMSGSVDMGEYGPATFTATRA